MSLTALESLAGSNLQKKVELEKLRAVHSDAILESMSTSIEKMSLNERAYFVDKHKHFFELLDSKVDGASVLEAQLDLNKVSLEHLTTLAVKLEKYVKD